MRALAVAALVGRGADAGVMRSSAPAAQVPAVSVWVTGPDRETP